MVMLAMQYCSTSSGGGDGDKDGESSGDEHNDIIRSLTLNGERENVRLPLLAIKNNDVVKIKLIRKFTMLNSKLEEISGRSK